MPDQIDEGQPRRFCRYPEYTGSGIEWLGDIPAHWETGRADRRMAVLKHPIDPGEIQGQDVLHYSIPNVQQLGAGAVEPSATIDSSKTEIDRPLLLVSKLNPRKATIALAKPHHTLATIASSEFIALVPTDCILEFARYYYLSEHVRLELSARVESATRSHQRCSPEDISKLPALWPSIPEQMAIAAFLDRETAKIDGLVARKERLIELLQEKRAALITCAVTKGLDPNAPMRDSGVDWLGEIPAHWDVKPLKSISDLQTGLTLGKRYKAEAMTTRPYLRVANVQDGYLALDDVAEVEVPVRDVRRFELRMGDVLMTEGGDFDKLGRGHVWTEQLTQCLHQNHIFAVRPRPSVLTSHFLALVMSSMYGRAYFTATSKQSTNLASTNSTKLRNLPIPLPGLDDQVEITGWIHRETAKIDVLIAKISHAIDHLKEFRIALISAAVTGKIDVREEVS